MTAVLGLSPEQGMNLGAWLIGAGVVIFGLWCLYAVIRAAVRDGTAQANRRKSPPRP